jgi:hypothetical protein
MSELCSFEAAGASFDLRPLKAGPKSSYRVRDLIDSVERNYTYVFNVCENALPPVPLCESRPSGSGPGPAFQLFNDGKCKRLGKDKDSMKWDLIDKEDPTRGVQLTYLQGDKCEIHPELDRSMTIKFICSSRWGKVPDRKVGEENCQYELEFETIFGCPLECPFSGRQLCGGHGFCDFDNDLNAPRCFCEQNWHGADCAVEGEEETAGCGGVCVALVFVLLLLLGLLAAAGVIYYRVHKLDALNLRFGELTTSFSAGASGGMGAEEETFSLNSIGH